MRYSMSQFLLVEYKIEEVSCEHVGVRWKREILLEKSFHPNMMHITPFPLKTEVVYVCVHT